jgi:hypothetical protein
MASRVQALSIGPQYGIIRGGKTVAVVKKYLFTLFRARFSVDVPGPDDLEARGNFLDHEDALSSYSYLHVKSAPESRAGALRGGCSGSGIRFAAHFPVGDRWSPKE